MPVSRPKETPLRKDKGRPQQLRVRSAEILIGSVSETTTERVIIVCTNIHLPQIVFTFVEIMK